MRHFFRANVSPDGYVLYTGRPKQTFRPQPLDIESREVPRGYLQAQARIDEVLKTRQVNWSLAVYWTGSHHKPVVTYGCHVAAPDDHGRKGLAFIHGIELEAVDQVRPCVVAILIRIAASSGRELLTGIKALAVGAGGVTAQEFLSDVAHSVESHIEGRSPPARQGAGTGAEVPLIAHDCVGGQATAWLTLASQQAGREPPWSIYDVLGKKGTVLTCAEPAQGEMILASRLLLGNVSRNSTREPQAASATTWWQRNRAGLVIGALLASSLSVGLGAIIWPRGGGPGGSTEKMEGGATPRLVVPASTGQTRESTEKISSGANSQQPVPAATGNARGRPPEKVDRRLADPLFKALTDPAPGALESLLKEGTTDERERMVAAVVLLRLRPRHEEAWKYLASALNSQDEEVRKAAQRIFADLLSRSVCRLFWPLP